MTSELLTPGRDHELLRFGIGLTDLAPGITQSHDRGLAYRVPHITRKLESVRPAALGLTSVTVGTALATQLGVRRPGLGLQSWSVAETLVFVLPSPSAANRRRDYGGRATRLAWWQELADLLPPLE